MFHWSVYMQKSHAVILVQHTSKVCEIFVILVISTLASSCVCEFLHGAGMQMCYIYTTLNTFQVTGHQCMGLVSFTFVLQFYLLRIFLNFYHLF